VKSFIFCIHPQISLGRSNRGNGVGGAWERREKCTRFWWESPWRSVKSEVRGIDEKIGDVDWIQLTQYRDRRRSVGNMAINLRMMAPRI
jgi:hypothetical protein